MGSGIDDTRKAIAIRYLTHSGGAWRAPPSDFPPWKTVHDYLVHERGLAAASIRRYLLTVERFLNQVPAPIEVGLRQLSAGEVTAFVVGQVGRASVADAKSMVTALRSLLRFLFVEGWVWPDLAFAVPTVANRKFSSLPKRLPGTWSCCWTVAHEPASDGSARTGCDTRTPATCSLPERH